MKPIVRRNIGINPPLVMKFLALTIVLVIAVSTSEAKKVRLGEDTTLECHGVNKCMWKSPLNVQMDFGRETKTYKNLRCFILKFLTKMSMFIKVFGAFIFEWWAFSSY